MPGMFLLPSIVQHRQCNLAACHNLVQHIKSDSILKNVESCSISQKLAALQNLAVNNKS